MSEFMGVKLGKNNGVETRANGTIVHTATKAKLPTEKQLRARVSRGAKLLDKKRPGWAKEVKIGSMDMSNDMSCVLGQLYGNVDSGAKTLGLNNAICAPDGWEAHGFDCWTSDEAESLQALEFKVLKELWLVAIRDRRVSTHTVASSKTAAAKQPKKPVKVKAPVKK